MIGVYSGAEVSGGAARLQDRFKVFGKECFRDDEVGRFFARMGPGGVGGAGSGEVVFATAGSFEDFDHYGGMDDPAGFKESEYARPY